MERIRAVLQNRQHQPQIQKHRTARRCKKRPEPSLFPESSDIQKAEQTAEADRQLCGQNVALHHTGEAKGRQIPLFLISQEQLIHPPHHKREENHSHALAQGRPGVQIDEPVDGQCVEKGRQKSLFLRTEYT